MAMQVHLFHQHIWDTVIILEEGNLPHPRCPRCNMLVTWRALNGRHLATTQCAKGEERKRRRLVEEDMRVITERSFQAYGKLLETVTSFKYLIQVMSAGENYCMVVVGKLGKDWKIWVWLTRILVQEGADPRVSSMFFKAVVQEVLLLG